MQKIGLQAPLTEKLKYIYSKVRKNWRDKWWWNDIILWHLVREYYRSLPNKGIFVMDEDWDNLIILDACRYDTFMETTGTHSDYRISRGSQTREFLKENFANHKFSDTVYVTANPAVNMLCKNPFYKIIPVWKYAWDKKINTVLPEVMIDYSLKAEDEYPDKRLILHFMQPHTPYLNNPEISPNFRWEVKSNLSLDEIYKAYKRNLEVVIPSAFNLAKKLKGKRVITSDHGEAFGERTFPFPTKVFGHPTYVYIPALVKLPWLVFEGKERKKIKEGDEKQRIKDQIRPDKKIERGKKYEGINSSSRISF